jgi:hypothetical protein
VFNGVLFAHTRVLEASLGAELESSQVAAVLGRQGNEGIMYTLRPDALLVGTTRYGVDSERLTPIASAEWAHISFVHVLKNFPLNVYDVSRICASCECDTECRRPRQHPRQRARPFCPQINPPAPAPMAAPMPIRLAAFFLPASRLRLRCAFTSRPVTRLNTNRQATRNWISLSHTTAASCAHYAPRWLNAARLAATFQP